MQQTPNPFESESTPADRLAAIGTPTTEPPPYPPLRLPAPHGESTTLPSVDAGQGADPESERSDLLSAMSLADWHGALTGFHGIQEVRPHESFESLDWSAYASHLCPAEPAIVSDKKAARYFLPCLLKDAPLSGQTLERASAKGEPTVGKMRSKEHVTESHALIFDFDGIGEQSFEQVRLLLEERGLTYVAYTTYSHGLEDKTGVYARVCVPVDRPLDVDSYLALWNAFVTTLPCPPDKTGSKLYQQQGMWVCHPDRKVFAKSWSNTGGVLNAEALQGCTNDDRAGPHPCAVAPKQHVPLPEYPPSDANIVADNCKQLAVFRDSRGANQSEPLWRDCLGVIAHCVDGRQYAHAWSSGHPGYSEDETDHKLDQRSKFPPTTCDQFRRTNPDGCTGCEQKVKSPIVLGIQRREASTPKSQLNDGNASFLPVVPHPQAIKPAEVLDEVIELLERFIIMDANQRVAVTLWIALSWFIGSAQVATLLLITAAERESGKTQLLAIVAMLCRHPMTVANSTTAFLFRAIEKWLPTLFIDEADTFMKESNDQKGLINAGHTRQSAWVGRVVGDAHEPTMFNVFCAKALAGINLAKHLPDATMSRGIVISLRRKLTGERCERLRHTDPEQFSLVTSKLARFAQDYEDRFRTARPSLPDALSDRQQDNWEPLYAIAQCAGAGWLSRCEDASLALSRAADLSENSGNSLLADIREILERKRCEKISSAQLVEELIEDQEAGWRTYNRGKPITPRQVAKLLRPYGIVSKTVRLGPLDTPKGYDRAQFDDAFARYLPAPNTDTDTDNPGSAPA